MCLLPTALRLGRWTDGHLICCGVLPGLLFHRQDRWTDQASVCQGGNVSNKARACLLAAARRVNLKAGAGGGRRTPCPNGSSTGLCTSCMNRRHDLFQSREAKWTHGYLVGVLLSDQSHIFDSLLYGTEGQSTNTQPFIFHEGSTCTDPHHNTTHGFGTLQMPPPPRGLCARGQNLRTMKLSSSTIVHLGWETKQARGRQVASLLPQVCSGETGSRY